MVKNILKILLCSLIFLSFNSTTVKAQEIPTEVVDNLIVNYIQERNSQLDYNTVKYISNCIIYYSYVNEIDPLIVTALICTESNFDPYACSSAGAKGLGQLTSLTAQSLGVSEPYDIRENIAGSCKYLKEQINSFCSYEQPIETALASYNAGPTTVRNYGGIPPYSETINYVNRIKNIYFHLYQSIQK